MVDGLRGLGVEISAVDDVTSVVGTAGRPTVRAAAVDVGLAGTVARFLPPVAAISDRPVRFDGDPRMRERPVGPLVVALRDLGVVVSTAPGDRLPLTVEGRGTVAGGTVRVDASSSSQLVSGLLLVAPCFTAGLTVRHVGPPVPSRPHLDMTVAMMREFGAQVDQPDEDTWVVAPGGYVARDVDVEPDLSGASAFLAAAMATGGRSSCRVGRCTPTQPGGRLLDVLTAMGGSASLGADGLELRGPSSMMRRRCRPARLARADAGARRARRAGGLAVADHRGRAHPAAGDRPDRGAGRRAAPRRRRRRRAAGRAGDPTDCTAQRGAASARRPPTGDGLGGARPGRRRHRGGRRGTTVAKTMPDFVARWARMLGGGEVG